MKYANVAVIGLLAAGVGANLYAMTIASGLDVILTGMLAFFCFTDAFIRMTVASGRMNEPNREFTKRLGWINLPLGGLLLVTATNPVSLIIAASFIVMGIESRIPMKS